MRAVYNLCSGQLVSLCLRAWLVGFQRAKGHPG